MQTQANRRRNRQCGPLLRRLVPHRFFPHRMYRGQKKSRLALSRQVAEKLPGDGRCSGEIKRSRFFRGVYERNVLETFSSFPSVCPGSLLVRAHICPGITSALGRAAVAGVVCSSAPASGRKFSDVNSKQRARDVEGRHLRWEDHRLRTELNPHISSMKLPLVISSLHDRHIKPKQEGATHCRVCRDSICE
jgi:hypothetical protein